MHTPSLQPVARRSTLGPQIDSKSSCDKGDDVDLSCQANGAAKQHRRLTFRPTFAALAFMPTFVTIFSVFIFSFCFGFIVDYKNPRMSSPQVVVTTGDYKNAKNAQPNTFQ
jgi:hypothetical protein